MLSEKREGCYFSENNGKIYCQEEMLHYKKEQVHEPVFGSSGSRGLGCRHFSGTITKSKHLVRKCKLSDLYFILKYFNYCFKITPVLNKAIYNSTKLEKIQKIIMKKI